MISRPRPVEARAALHTLSQQLTPMLGDKHHGTFALGVACGADVADILQPAAEQTQLFPIGSITKLITALCVSRMLDDRPDITLETSVNAVLGTQALRGRHGAAVTLAHLLTHRAGFDYSDFGLGARPQTGEDDPMRRFQPRLVQAPGGMPVYSNFGVAVLGRVLERVHGQSFPQIAHSQVLEPLGMADSGFETPLAIGRLWRPTSRVGVASPTFPLLPLHPFFAPAGGAFMSTADALRLALLILRGARGEATPHFSPAAMERFLDPLFRSEDGAIGIGMLISRFRVRGVTVLGHTGSWPGYSAFLCVVPELDAALFCAIAAHPNTKLAPDALWGAALEALLDLHGVAPCPILGSCSTLRLAGTYLSSKIPRTSAERAVWLWSGKGVTHVRATETTVRIDGTELAPRADTTFEPTQSGASLASLVISFQTGAYLRGSQREAHTKSRLAASLYPWRPRFIAATVGLATFPVAWFWPHSLLGPALHVICAGLVAASALAVALVLHCEDGSLRVLVGDRSRLARAEAAAALCALGCLVLLADFFVTAMLPVTPQRLHHTLFLLISCGLCFALHDMRLLRLRGQAGRK